MKFIKEINKKENGQAFIIVLILLVLGGLMIGPLLAYMNTGLIAGQAHEKRMDELYAADSGVEDALWQIKNKTLATLFTDYDPDDYVTEYQYPDSLEVNDKDVDVAIQNINEITYRIESTATSPDTGSSTTIESYVNILDFTLFTDNAITSLNDIEIGNNSEVNGTVQHNPWGELDNKGIINGAIKDDEEILGWPTAEQMSDFYLQDLEDNKPYTVYPDGTVINVRYNDYIGPLYCEGDLTIETTKAGEEATLHGTVYVAGNLDFKQTGKSYDIHLNDHTIYVEGEGQPYAINFPSNQCNLYGPGCIIAVHDIFFHPSIEGTDFIFVMSIEGETQFNPGGEFTGSIAGDVEVDLQPGNTLTWTTPPPNLNLPGMGDTNVISSILTWEISLQ